MKRYYEVRYRDHNNNIIIVECQEIEFKDQGVVFIFNNKYPFLIIKKDDFILARLVEEEE